MTRGTTRNFEVVTAPTLTPGTQQWRVAAEFLRGDDRDRFANMLHAGDQARFLTGRTELRRLAARCFGVCARSVSIKARCPACRGPHGKPSVWAPDGRRLRASLAHSGRVVVAGVSDAAPLGVDVEHVDGVRFIGFDHEVLTSTERQWLAACPSARRASLRARIWTAKEAVLKAAGVGLSMPLSDVEISEPWAARTGARMHDAARHTPFDVRTVEVPAGYTAHVALLAGVNSPCPQVDPVV